MRYHGAGVGNNWVDWTFTGLTPGRHYAVSATWLPGYASNVTYDIFGGAAGGTPVGSATVDQRIGANDYQDASRMWEELTIVQVPVGETTLTVRLSDNADNWVYADGARLEQVYLPEVEVTLPGAPATSIESGEGVEFGTKVYMGDGDVDLRITNTGILPLSIGNVTLTGNGFSMVQLPDPPGGSFTGASLNSGEWADFRVSFDTAVTHEYGHLHGRDHVQQQRPG